MKYMYSVIFLLILCSTSFSQNPCSGTPTVTYAGKIYNTVQIGSQCWLKENLDVGTRINGSLEQINNGIIEKYCYNDDSATCTTYGGLYQWAEAIQYKNGATNTTSPNPAFTGTVQGICPTGWHIPTNDEFTALSTTVSGNASALKAIIEGGTNTSGFSALLAGYRNYLGTFGSLGYYTYFWSSSENHAITSTAYYMGLSLNGSSIYQGYDDKVVGHSVRCAMDASTGINDHSNNTLPKSIDLLQNFPNPFNPNTTISYSLPERTKVVLSVYNELGEKIAELVNGEKASGTYSVKWNANNFATGVYFYELKTDKSSVTKKLILMK